MKYKILVIFLILCTVLSTLVVNDSYYPLNVEANVKAIPFKALNAIPIAVTIDSWYLVI